MVHYEKARIKVTDTELNKLKSGDWDNINKDWENLSRWIITFQDE